MLDNNDLRQGKHLKRLINKSLPCVSSLFSSRPCVNHDDMIRKRHVYETAFDSATRGDVDDDDVVSNHPVLVQLTKVHESAPGTSADCDTQPCGLVQSKSLDVLSRDVRDLQLDSKERAMRVYTPSPPSTAPLAAKFDAADNTRKRTKDLKLPVKSLRDVRGSDPSLRKAGHDGSEKRDETRKMFKRYKDGSKEIFMYTKSRRFKYSSSESMATSSSGSIDSLQSSTSDGDRSTSSSESRQSTSLSSHSSDSGNTGSYAAPTFAFHPHANKLNVLSPISDKSSQEGISDEVEARDDPPKPPQKPKRLPLFTLGFCKTDLQGSDSGISIQSRHASGSVTSVDLKDLPFDMPKLKRRFRPPEAGRAAGIGVPLSLDVARKKPTSLSFGRQALNLNVGESGGEEIDADLPLERQGWYHGSITRVEAEILLKLLSEGSFLVRNSESQRHDHFLSLKLVEM